MPNKFVTQQIVVLCTFDLTNSPHEWMKQRFYEWKSPYSSSYSGLLYSACFWLTSRIKLFMHIRYTQPVSGGRWWWWKAAHVRDFRFSSHDMIGRRLPPGTLLLMNHRQFANLSERQLRRISGWDGWYNREPPSNHYEQRRRQGSGLARDPNEWGRLRLSTTQQSPPVNPPGWIKHEESNKLLECILHIPTIQFILSSLLVLLKPTTLSWNA